MVFILTMFWNYCPPHLLKQRVSLLSPFAYQTSQFTASLHLNKTSDWLSVKTPVIQSEGYSLLEISLEPTFTPALVVYQ